MNNWTVQEARRLYGLMGPGSLKEAVQLARARTNHPHRSKGLRPKQRVTIVTRCPITGALGVAMSRVVELDKWQPYGQGGKSYEIAAPVA